MEELLGKVESGDKELLDECAGVECMVEHLVGK